MLEEIRAIIDRYLSDKGLTGTDYVVERPKNKEFGHASTNIAMKLAKELRRKPIDIANELVVHLEDQWDMMDHIEAVMPGFINFHLKPGYFHLLLDEIIEKKIAFRKPADNHQKVQIEFVSANPTGPLTIGHGRQAVLGDSIARIMDWFGYDVTREYYFNDAGRQMRLLGLSVYSRYMGLLGKDVPLPEDGYQGEYIIDIAQKLLDEQGDKYSDNPHHQAFIDIATREVFQDIRHSLEQLNIHHDVYYNEKDLYNSGKVNEVLSLLEDKGYTYKFEGATWFKTTIFGAEKDRVLVKSSGEPTYRLPDIAYHREKILRNFDIIIDIFGADHHATWPDVMSALQAMGYSTDHIRVLLHQFVTLTKDGEVVKMSTRKATFVTLDELVDLVGPDVARYFYIMRSMDAHLNFDIALAQKESDENPVYYLQYAHARMNNILVHSKEKGVESFLDADLSLLTEDEIIEVLNIISEYSEAMEVALKALDPIHIVNYLQKLAAAFHRFYARHRVVTDDLAMTKARLKFVYAVKIVLANLLGVLGIHAPESM